MTGRQSYLAIIDFDLTTQDASREGVKFTDTTIHPPQLIAAAEAFLAAGYGLRWRTSYDRWDFDPEADEIAYEGRIAFWQRQPDGSVLFAKDLLDIDDDAEYAPLFWSAEDCNATHLEYRMRVLTDGDGSEMRWVPLPASNLL